MSLWHFKRESVELLALIRKFVKQWGNYRYCDIVDCIRMTWSVPAAVPQMKLMKHTVICSLTWLG